MCVRQSDTVRKQEKTFVGFENAYSVLKVWLSRGTSLLS
jgi:hypothetical protein